MAEQKVIFHTPLPLHERVELSGTQAQQIGSMLSELSENLGSLPTLASQDGEVIGFAGLSDPAFAERIARTINRTWREGATRPSREIIRFEEETLEEATGRSNFSLYSCHVAGALTLTVGWQFNQSITELRAETGKAAQEILRLIHERG